MHAYIRTYLYMCITQGLGERIQALNQEVFGGVLSTQQLQQLESTEAKQVLCAIR